MTNKQLRKYFKSRPGIDELYLVGTVVFIDPAGAEKYASQVNGKVEVKHRAELPSEDQDVDEGKVIQLNAAGSGDDATGTDTQGEDPEAGDVTDTDTQDEDPEADDAADTDAQDEDPRDGYEMTKEAAEALLIKTELNRQADYNLLHEMVIALSLASNGRSKSAYIEALKSYKEHLINGV